MNAWLITWEWMSDSAAVREKIVAILSSRRTVDSIAQLVELLYAQATSNLGDLAAYARRPKSNPYPATSREMINDVPHGERIICGSHPWLYARRVTQLSVRRDARRSHEIVSWTEPPQYRFTNNGASIEVAKAGASASFARPNTQPINPPGRAATGRDSAKGGRPRGRAVRA